VLLVLAGGYIVYYWVFNLSTDIGTETGSGPARFVEGLSADATSWIDNAGGWLPAVLVATIAFGVFVAATQNRRSSPRSAKAVADRGEPEDTPASGPSPSHDQQGEPVHVKGFETASSHLLCMSASRDGSLIQAAVGSFGGVGRRPLNRSGLAANAVSRTLARSARIAVAVP